MPRSRARATKASKSSKSPSAGSIASWPPVGRPDGPRGADVAGLRDGVAAGQRGAVRALAVHRADRVDRGQVDHVEAHRGDAVELLGGGGERAVDGIAVLVAAPGGPGEELVPGAEQRARAVDVDLARLAAGDELADGTLDHDRVDGGEQRGGDAVLHRERGVAQRVRRGEEQVAVRPFGGAAAHALEQPRADLEVVRQLVRVPARRSSLTVTACRQVAHGSLQASTRNVHRPGSSGTTVAVNRSTSSRVGAIRTCWPGPSLPTFFHTTFAAIAS